MLTLKRRRTALRLNVYLLFAFDPTSILEIMHPRDVLDVGLIGGNIYLAQAIRGAHHLLPHAVVGPALADKVKWSLSGCRRQLVNRHCTSHGHLPVGSNCG